VIVRFVDIGGIVDHKLSSYRTVKSDWFRQVFGLLRVQYIGL
jgi:hypothetical protein